MHKRSGTLLLWSPRVLALLVCAFLSLFALDAFGNGKALRDAVPDFALHLAPVLTLLAVVGISWRWPWVGGLVFTALAIAYAYTVRNHVSWVLCISGPLLVVGVLYLWSWRGHRTLRAGA